MVRLVRAGIHFYLAGIVILSLGIALTIQSMLGTSPYDSLLVGLNRTFGLTVGSWEVVVGLSMVIFNALAEKKRPEYFALLTSLITGIGIDSWLFIVDEWIVTDTWIGQSICLAMGILFTCVGVAFYLQSSIAPNPMDRSMLVVTKLTGWGVTYSRALISVVLVGLAFLFDGAIGIGTLINALFSGMIIAFFLPFANRLNNGMKKQIAKDVS